MAKRKKSTTGTIRWRCDCGAIQETGTDPVELARTGVPWCCGCEREMDPCETDLQPVLNALSRCAFVLFKIAEGDTNALRKATAVVRTSVKLLVEYGEQDEWMAELQP